MTFSFSPGWAVALILVASLGILLSRNRREAIVALAVQYLGVFWLVSILWPFGMAAVVLIAGWMSGAVLGASQLSKETVVAGGGELSLRLFRLVAAAIVWLLVFALAPQLVEWIPASLPVIRGSLALIGMGLLQLGVTREPLWVILGLLTALAGFEIIYAAVEVSVLVAGLLAVIKLGLAMAGAYLETASAQTEEGE